MIFRVLLLINIISRVSGTFLVNVTQMFYQTEENNNVTLEWTFTNTPDRSSTFIIIYCELISQLKPLYLFRLHDGDEVSESQDEQFSGRVQFDRDVLREGRVRLRLSRLRTDDSGLYLCKVGTKDGWSSDRCRLNVTAARHWPERDADLDLNTTNWKIIIIYCGLGVIAAILLVACCILLVYSVLRNDSGGLWKRAALQVDGNETV